LPKPTKNKTTTATKTQQPILSPNINKKTLETTTKSNKQINPHESETYNTWNQSFSST
jgi:hypothetical protein